VAAEIHRFEQSKEVNDESVDEVVIEVLGRVADLQEIIILSIYFLESSDSLEVKLVEADVEAGAIDLDELFEKEVNVNADLDPPRQLVKQS
jgi:hypothetical protein